MSQKTAAFFPKMIQQSRKNIRSCFEIRDEATDRINGIKNIMLDFTITQVTEIELNPVKG